MSELIPSLLLVLNRIPHFRTLTFITAGFKYVGSHISELLPSLQLVLKLTDTLSKGMTSRGGNYVKFVLSSFLKRGLL